MTRPLQYTLPQNAKRPFSLHFFLMWLLLGTLAVCNITSWLSNSFIVYFTFLLLFPISGSWECQGIVLPNIIRLLQRASGVTQKHNNHKWRQQTHDTESSALPNSYDVRSSNWNVQILEQYGRMWHITKPSKCRQDGDKHSGWQWRWWNCNRSRNR
jgi:hypothetical protein